MLINRGHCLGYYKIERLKFLIKYSYIIVETFHIKYLSLKTVFFNSASPERKQAAYSSKLPTHAKLSVA